MQINYDQLAKRYDVTREIDYYVYNMLCCLLSPSKGDILLDFGCGTGNYIKQLSSKYNIDVYGIEPSLKMRCVAQNKCNNNIIKEGSHLHIPFPNNYFKKLYCIDVVHHIMDIEMFYKNLFNVSAAKSILCICTESPEQLCKKFWLKYFPSILEIDRRRFHSIDNLIETGEKNGWKHKQTTYFENEYCGQIATNLFEIIKLKTLSVLQLISDDEYIHGLEIFKTDYANQIIVNHREGYTFILFEKE